jgi:hypothetical protein
VWVFYLATTHIKIKALKRLLTTNLGAKAPTTNAVTSFATINLGAKAPTTNLDAKAPTTNFKKLTEVILSLANKIPYYIQSL